jgi:hypothetical protein
VELSTPAGGIAPSYDMMGALVGHGSHLLKIPRRGSSGDAALRPVRNAKWQGWIALAPFAVGQFDERAPVLDIWEGEGFARRGARSPLASTMAL